MRVRVVWRVHRSCARGVQVLADVEIRAIVARLAAVPLVARPPEVFDRDVSGAQDPIDLFPGVPADIGDPDLGGAGPDREPERVAQSVCHDPLGVRVAGVRIAGRRGSRDRVETEDRPVQRRGIGRRLVVLAAERPAFRGGRRLRPPDATRWISTRILRVPRLAIVHVIEGCRVAGGGVQHSVRAESQRADRVAGELLAPIVDQHLLGARRVAVGLEPGQTAARHAPIGRCPRWRRTRVRIGSGGTPLRSGAADVGVVRIEGVDPRVGREGRGQREAEQAAIPEVVRVGPEVGERRGRRVAQAVEDQNDASLLRNEDPTIGGEADGGGIRQAAERDRVRKARGEGLDSNDAAPTCVAGTRLGNVEPHQSRDRVRYEENRDEGRYEFSMSARRLETVN